MENNLIESLFDKMADNWPSEIVARRKVEEFTGGMICGKTIANYEGKKDGPVKIKIGRMVGYPKTQFVEWLKSHAEIAQ